VKQPAALAFDAATDRLCIGAAYMGRVEFADLEPSRDHTDAVFLHAAAVLQKVGCSVAQLDFVACGRGPGSFTGVRVATAAAQSLGFGRSLPVCRVSSLALLAATAMRITGAEAVGVCLDARMDRVYTALYLASPTGPMAFSPDAWVDPRECRLPGDSRFAAVGDGWSAWPAMAERHGSRIAALEPALLPSGRELISMAIKEYQAGNTVRPQDALPEYLGQQPARPLTAR